MKKSELAVIGKSKRATVRKSGVILWIHGKARKNPIQGNCPVIPRNVAKS
ncbi:MAG: hypothetical protein JSR33_02610 [Proteobacteria bacterium]|nr:hypothetical protein [Pseudomonadota bacterium]